MDSTQTHIHTLILKQNFDRTIFESQDTGIFHSPIKCHLLGHLFALVPICGMADHLPLSS